MLDYPAQRQMMLVMSRKTHHANHVSMQSVLVRALMANKSETSGVLYLASEPLLKDGIEPG